MFVVLAWTIFIKENTKTGGVAQVVIHLLCKHKALSLRPTPTKKKKKSTKNLKRGGEGRPPVRLDFIKLKHFCSSKEATKKMFSPLGKTFKQQHLEWTCVWNA
jgi:hypothetical protein